MTMNPGLPAEHPYRTKVYLPYTLSVWQLEIYF